MNTRSIISVLAASALVLFAPTAGCAPENPVTIVFTGDTKGHLVPAG